MRKLYYSLFTLFALLLTINPAQAQLFEDFEGAQKSGYAAGTVDLSSGTWYLEDALIRSDGDGDLKNGNQSVRIRDGFLRMNFDFNDGADELTFLAGNSDFSDDGGGKLQVYYSVNGGSSWTELGDEITLTDNLEEYNITVGIQDPVRFRFNKTAGGRVNIDDVHISEFIVPEDEATIEISLDGFKFESGDSIYFAPTLTGEQRQKTVEIKNRGNEVLEISSVSLNASGFTVSDLTDSSLAFSEETELTLTFSPQDQSVFSGELVIESNAANGAVFTINLQGEGLTEGDIIPIADARELPLESRVTVAGRVTVANQFQGPVFMQDGTAGIAVYWPALHTAVEIGDSVIVTGPLTVFQPIAGSPSDFLLQIAEIEGDDNITFEVVDTEKRIPEPKWITVQEMNTGEFESQLVVIQNAVIDHTGAFQGNVNYGLTDGTAEAFIRIDANSNLVGALAPQGTVNIIGVVDKFAGDYQLKPRFVEDMGVEAITYPGENVAKDQTLDVVTWNVEWFGSTGNGPSDEALQMENVKTVITTIDADIYALQEISNSSTFYQLVDELQDYNGILADFSQTQKTAYLYKKATIDSLHSGLLTDAMTQQYWANGRFPLVFRFNVSINDEEQEVYAYNIHAKATTDNPESDYNQRLNASQELKLYLDNIRNQDNVLILGDYNDEINESVIEGKDSPYKNFVDDAEYTVVTKNLEDKGLTSYTSISMLDHITFTSELSDEYFEGTERVENTSYIGSYLSSTSDHFPVWTRFKFGEIVYNSNEQEEMPRDFVLEQNYPNPFNPTTVINLSVPEAANVKLEVFNMLGQRVSLLLDEYQPAGKQSVTFNASHLTSGMYMYRLTVNKQYQLTRKMMLIK